MNQNKTSIILGNQIRQKRRISTNQIPIKKKLIKSKIA